MDNIFSMTGIIEPDTVFKLKSTYYLNSAAKPILKHDKHLRERSYSKSAGTFSPRYLNGIPFADSVSVEMCCSVRMTINLQKQRHLSIVVKVKATIYRRI